MGSVWKKLSSLRGDVILVFLVSDEDRVDKAVRLRSVFLLKLLYTCTNSS